ncbi:MAG TPA: hypothetical protein VNC17_18155 [Thermoleophilaceae bacterium]|nr:hypothetical protein [Thermoleophilaceae bacterium]
MQVAAVRGSLEERLAADGQADPTDATGLDVGAALEEVDRREQVELALVPGVGVGSPPLSPSPRRSKISTPYPWRASIRAGRWVPLRPKATITAAPLREGTYDPSSVSPSLVCSSTASTFPLPSSMSSTGGRATWVPT